MHVEYFTNDFNRYSDVDMVRSSSSYDNFD
jgi:hypothetical protein